MKAETDFIVVGEGGAILLSGTVEWGETADRVLYRHPMTGAQAENPLSGWADAPGQTAHATIAEIIAAIDATDTWLDDCYGLSLAVWRWYGNSELVFDGEQSVETK